MDVPLNEVISPTRDSTYYFNTVTFIVEDCLFKVQKRHFDGPFGKILNLPSDDAVSNDQLPICLMGIKKEDFERLLEMMDPVHQPATISRDDWEYALKLSCVCDVPDMKKMAIEKITKMGMESTDKILLGQAYGVPDWVFSGYKELAERREPISRAEGQRIGVDTLAGLCKVREAGIQKRKGRIFKASYDSEDNIREEFVQELKNVKAVTIIVGTERPHIDENPRTPLLFTPVRNHKFYVEQIVFLVEDTLFKVPRSAFDAIELFRTVFTLPGTQVDGSDDEHPFKLPIKKAEFRAFLRVLYPNDMKVRTADLSEEDCISVLKLADMWEFLEIRDLAIKELSNRTMDPFTKVLLAKRYKIPVWLRLGYQELANREEIITCEEAKQLGWDAAIRIFHLRDKAMARFVQGMMEEVRWHINENDINIAFAKELIDVTEI